MKKGMSMLLVLCMLMSLFAAVPMTAQAAEGAQVATAKVEIEEFHASVLSADGSLWVWGENFENRFGVGEWMKSITTPFEMERDVKQYSSPYVLKFDGTLWNRKNPNEPIMNSVKSIEFTTSDCTGVLDDDGTLWMWGEIAPFNFYKTPQKIMNNVRETKHSFGTTLILCNNGELWGIGRNDYYQLGKTNYEVSKPIKIMDEIEKIDICLASVAAIKCDKTLWTWGDNDYGQLGIGTKSRNDDCLNPTKVLDDVVDVDMDEECCVAIKSNGDVWAWGDNFENHLDVGADLEEALVPTKTSITDAKKVYVDSNEEWFYTLIAVLKNDNSLWVTGRNRLNRYKHVMADDSDIPVKILDNVKDVYSIGDYMFVLQYDGSLWQWGKGTRGYCKKVLDNVCEAATDGNGVFIALKIDGTVWTWGKSNHHTLGVVAESFLEEPTQILSGIVTEADIPIRVKLNGEFLQMDQPPVSVNDRTLVPLRAIFEAMNMEIGWDDVTQTVTATGNGNSLSLQIDNTIATVNGQAVTMDVPPMVINGRTLVPVRFIAESVGAKVDWDETTKTVFIECGMGDKTIHIASINCEEYTQNGRIIWIQPHQYVSIDVVDSTGYYVDPSRYTIESNNPYITVDKYRTLTAKCENGQFGILWLKDPEGKTVSSVNVHVVNDIATRNFAVNNINAIASLPKKRSFDLWGSFQKDNGLKWGVAAVYEFYQDPIGYIGGELNYQKQITATLIDALTSDRALEILQQKIEQEYIDNWYEITMDVYDIGGDDLTEASKEYLSKERNRLIMHQKNMMAKRAEAYVANNGKTSAFDVYVDDVERSEAIVKELDWTGKELDKTQEQLKDITKNEKFLKKFDGAMNILDVAGDSVDAMNASVEQKQMIVALQDVKEQYATGLSLCAQQTSDPYFKQACLDAIEIMNLSFEEAQRSCWKKGFEHFVGEGLKETIEGAIEKVSEVALKKAVEVIMVNLGASAEQISAAVSSVGTTAGMFAKAKIAAKITASVCNFFGSTSDSIRASLDLKTLLTIEQEMSAINEQYLREITNGNNRINEYVATAEVLKPIMIYACGLTNTIYNAEMNSRWDIFARTMKGEEGYDDDFDRIYSDEVNGINNIQFVLY